MNYKYTADAITLISSLKEFNKEKFEQWYKENNIYISIPDYMQYILNLSKEESKKEMELVIKDIKIDIDLKFNQNLIPIIDKSNIKLDDLKKFFIFGISIIGSNAIVHYLNKKDN